MTADIANRVEVVAEIGRRRHDGGGIVLHLAVTAGSRGAGRCDGGQAEARTSRADGGGARHIEVKGLEVSGGAVSHHDVGDHLFASIGDHSIAVEVHPAVQIGRRSSGVVELDGHSDTCLTLHQNGLQGHTIFVIDVGDVVTGCREVGDRGDFRVLQIAKTEGV